MFTKIKLFCFAAFLGLSSCSSEDEYQEINQPIFFEKPSNFPDLAYTFPNNPLSEKGFELGRKLFFDGRLSRTNLVSCNFCHEQPFAFTHHGHDLSHGVDDLIGIRNAPAIQNMAFQSEYFFDGASNNLEMVSIVPIHNPVEMDENLPNIIQKLKADSQYQKLFKEAYSDTVTINGALKAIGTFLRTLISGNSKFDEYLKGRTTSFNESETRGMELFFSSKTSCSECHGGFNLRKEGFFNNGFFETYPDSGRQRITLNENDRAKFSVPSLRNIALTAPYMHNGSVNSLEEVVNRYNNGGYDHPSKSELIRPLNLSEGEKVDLIRFLNTLTDFTFINNEAFMPE
jgi:cytochrome c peroxidase